MLFVFACMQKYSSCFPLYSIHFYECTIMGVGIKWWYIKQDIFYSVYSKVYIFAHISEPCLLKKYQTNLTIPMSAWWHLAIKNAHAFLEMVYVGSWNCMVSCVELYCSFVLAF